MGPQQGSAVLQVLPNPKAKAGEHLSPRQRSALLAKARGFPIRGFDSTVAEDADSEDSNHNPEQEVAIQIFII